MYIAKISSLSAQNLNPRAHKSTMQAQPSFKMRTPYGESVHRIKIMAALLKAMKKHPLICGAGGLTTLAVMAEIFADEVLMFFATHH